jgi:nucleoid-associated protein YgaU/DNA-binding SARP family transcriptional activator
MNRHPRGAPLLHAVVALSGLVLLVAGTPIVLWQLAGWPLPTSLPSLDDMADGLSRGRIDDTAIVNIVAVMGWLAWLHAVVSALLEAVAWCRGRTAPRLVLGGPVQRLVRNLIATTTVLLSSSAVPAAAHTLAATPAPVEHVAAVTHAAPGPAGTTGRPEHDRPVGTSSDDAGGEGLTGPSYVVQRRDTLWGLAQRHLGDPFRWRELFELNQGRRQADGRALTDPNQILVGWTLTFPADAQGITEPGPPPPVAEPPVTCPEPVAPAQQPPTGPAAPAAGSDPPDGDHASTPATTAPHRPVAAPSPAAEEGDAPTVPDGTPAPPDGDIDSPSTGTTLAPLVGGGLLAAAVVVLLNRLRGVRTRHHRSTPHRDPDTEDLELKLRHAADVEGANRLDLALRAFAAGLKAVAGAQLPRVLAVRFQHGDLEVLLDRALVAAPECFTSTGDPRGWRLEPATTGDQLQATAGGVGSPLPSLVTVGTADGDPTLIDVETGGLLAIAADDGTTTALIVRLATELATSSWSDHVYLVTVGADLANLPGTDRVAHHDDITAAIDQLYKVAGACHDRLNTTGHPSTLSARLADHHGDGWIPTILITTEPLPPADFDRLAELVAGGGRGVGAIVPAAGPGPGWILNAHGATVELSPHGLRLGSLTLSEETADHISGLLAEERLDLADHDDEPPSVGPSGPIPASCDPGPFADRAFEIEIRVLGGVEISGGITVSRPKLLEVIAYLALHPAGVTDDRVKAVFWPAALPTRATFNTTISMARKALGYDSEGNLYFPHFSTNDHRYHLTDKVTTDLARLEARIDHARRSPPQRAIDTLRDGLQLVRGRPFDVGRGYEWAFSEGWASQATMTIAAAAHHLAELALAAGDLDLANWAALKGLEAAPGDEALYRDRMLCAQRAGNLTAVRRIMAELCEIVEAAEPYDDLHPDTVRLFQRIIGRA